MTDYEKNVIKKDSITMKSDLYRLIDTAILNRTYLEAPVKYYGVMSDCLKRSIENYFEVKSREFEQNQI